MCIKIGKALKKWTVKENFRKMNKIMDHDFGTKIQLIHIIFAFKNTKKS